MTSTSLHLGLGEASNCVSHQAGVIIALFKDGTAAWCLADEAADNEVVASASAIVRLEARLNLAEFRETEKHLFERMSK